MTELSSILLREYSKLLETEELSDMEILIGKEPNTKTFRLHSFILKVCSPYFRIALSNNWVKVENNIIKFKKQNISVQVFEILIKYMYGVEVQLEDNDVKTNVELLIAADELCLDDLCSYIEEHLLEDEEQLKSNFVLIYSVKRQYDQFTNLSQFYLDTYRQDPSLIFTTDDFSQIKQEHLIEFLERNEHSLKPIQLWDKLMEWTIAQHDNELPLDVTNWTQNHVTTFGTLIQPLFSYIKFKEISSTDFFNKIKPFKNIFEDKFYITILEHYSFNSIPINNVLSEESEVNAIEENEESEESEESEEEVVRLFAPRLRPRIITGRSYISYRRA